MHATLPTILGTIRRSHAIFSKVEVYYAGVRQDTDTALLLVTNGRVDVSDDASSRRMLTLEVVDPTGALTPSVSTPTNLAPYGAELKVWRGTALTPSDTPTWTPLGLFRISRADVADDSTAKISITAYDRARTIARNAFANPYVINAGQNYVTAIIALLQFASPPGMTWTSATVATGMTTPNLIFDKGADPWLAAQNMAKSISYELYFDVDGNVVLQPDTTLDGGLASPWNLIEGSNSIVLSVASAMDDDPGYNGVIVYGEAATATGIARGEAWDTDQDSPTNSNGPYGRVPKIITSPYVINDTQANSMASTELAKELGSVAALTVAAVPNPCLEIGDVLTVTRKKIKAVDHRVKGFSVPLTATEAQQLTLAKQRSS